jgi:uncharacterized protein
MLTRDAVIEKVASFSQEILANGVSLDKVILFGSYAKGTPNKYSDIDVALVSDCFSGFGFEDRKFFSKINIKKSYLEIETKTYPTQYFYNSDPFIEEILKYGIVIYEK